MSAPAPPSAAAARRPIRELPDELISQIAAGEVVDRPAGVVRELIDNALDAGAREIGVRLQAGGVRLILVEDDGVGIPAQELALALKRHATSKIASLDELEGVLTMGFRGEALAAIAAIAELSITSRSADAPTAQRLDARSGELQPAARAVGTSVEVRELFFATPARRKFLKTDATELAHCVEAVRRHALVRPEVGFTVWHDGKLVTAWRRASPEQRVRDVLGDEFIAASRELDALAGGLRLTGRVGLPDAARARTDGQYVYVNGRPVRDKLIAHGARTAYDDVLHGTRQPAYLLFLQLAPDRVDVNVHPTKTEVRFRDARAVHQAVRYAVEDALALPRAITAHGALFEATEPAVWNPTPMPVQMQAPLGLGAAAVRPFAGFELRPGAPPAVHEPAPAWSDTPEPSAPETAGDPDGHWPLGRALAQLGGAYILAENAQGLVIVDMHAAHERVVYERLKAALERDQAARIDAQPLLIPATFAATPAEMATAEGRVDALARLGLDIAALAPGVLAVRSQPAALSGGDVVELARAVLAELARFDASHAIERAQHEILSSMACHGAVRTRCCATWRRPRAPTSATTAGRPGAR